MKGIVIHGLIEKVVKCSQIKANEPKERLCRCAHDWLLSILALYFFKISSFLIVTQLFYLSLLVFKDSIKQTVMYYSRNILLSLRYSWKCFNIRGSTSMPSAVTCLE